MAVDVRFLGHSAFHISGAGADVLVDPFLTGNPKAAATADEVPADVILLTHGHGDHLGDTIRLWNEFKPPVIALVELRGWLEGQGVESSFPQNPNKGGTVDIDGVKLTFTDANHSSSVEDGTYAGEPAGIVLELEDGFKLYFAGDTNVFGDMALIRRIYAPDVAVLPIGGHFTMAPPEAAVALELLGVKRCVPCHYGTFPLLKGTPEELAKLAPGVELITPEPGETVEL